MRIEKATAKAELIRLLYRLGVIDAVIAEKYIDHLQVMVFESESNN